MDVSYKLRVNKGLWMVVTFGGRMRDRGCQLQVEGE